MYSVVFSDEAKKSFAKLQKEEQSRIVSALGRCQIRPGHFLKRLVGHPYYRLRAGDERIIIDICENRVLFVITIEHRKKSYKRLPE